LWSPRTPTAWLEAATIQSALHQFKTLNTISKQKNKNKNKNVDVSEF
jgi:hypothetical protein